MLDQNRPSRFNALARLTRHVPAALALAYLVSISTLVVLAPLFFTMDPDLQDIELFGQPMGPTINHWMGSDELGRDVLSRLIYGGRISIAVGLASSCVSTLIGTFVGALCGLYGGWVDKVLMRAVDVMLSIPILPLLLLFSSLVKPSPWLLVVLIGALGWMGTARLVRGQFLVIRHSDYVTAARGLGMSDPRLMFRHILPNAVGPIIVSATLAVGSGILIESAMSFLGLGVQPPASSWGNMLNAASPWLSTAPLLAIAPGILIFLTVMSVNFLGDGLHDVIDPS